MDKTRTNRSPLWRLSAEQEVEEELAFHLEMRVRQYLDEGLDEPEARRRALAGFGEPGELVTTCRQIARTRNRRFELLDAWQEWVTDFRYALRQFWRNPVFSALVVGILSLGLGANVAVFSLVDRLLLNPLDYPRPERLVTVWEEHASRSKRKNVVNPANFVLFREESETMQRMAGFVTIDATLSDDAESALRAKARVVTDGYFEILGVAPVIGRAFDESDYADGSARTVILSQHVWRGRFGARHDVIGQTLSVDDREATVVGVMPHSFGLDMGPEVRPYGNAPDIYMTLPVTPEWRTASGRWLMVVARLEDEASLDDAHAEMELLSERMGEVRQEYNAEWRAHLIPLDTHLNDAARPPLTALAVAVVLILLIVCVNVAGLLTARAATRSAEMLIRDALGAGRARLVRQLFVESLLMSAIALSLGLGLALAATPILEGLLPIELLSTATVRAQSVFPTRMLALSVTMLLVCTISFGILPGVIATRRLHHVRGDGRAGPEQYRLRFWLVFAEIVLAVLLLVGSGLTLQSFSRLLDVDPGFAHSGLVSFAVAPSRELSDQQLFTFYDDLLSQLANTAGVREAGAITHIPIASVGAATSYFPLDRAEPDAGTAPSAAIRVIRGSYFQTMRIPLLAGRSFDSSDRPDANLGAVVVNRQLADEHWPGDSALGKQLQVSWGEGGARQIVGVVSDVKHAGPASPVKNTIYFPHAQERERAMTVVLRSDEPIDAVMPRVRAVVSRIDPKLPLYDVKDMSAVLGGSVQKERVLALLIGIMAVAALTLAALGIYGMMAYAVITREREFGLRMALGASPSSIATLVLRQALVLLVAALSAGIAVSLLGGRFIESILFEVSASDALTYVAVSVLLALGCIGAAMLPAMRASRVAPTIALRQQ